jgi:hypothetical protein
MRKIKCPLCEASVVVCRDMDTFGTYSTVLLAHTPENGQAPTVPVRRLGGSQRLDPVLACLGSGLSEEMARDVAADRQAGVHLRPHP